MAFILTITMASCRADEAVNPFIDVPMDGAEPNESAFAIQHHEVTIGEYLACVEAGVCAAWIPPNFSGEASPLEPAPSQYNALRLGAGPTRYGTVEEDSVENAVQSLVEDFKSDLADRLPVTIISPTDAQTYCKWRGGALPNRLQRSHVVTTYAPDALEMYRDAMLSGEGRQNCSAFNLPFHDVRVLIEQFGSIVPEYLSSDKTVRMCRTGPSLANEVFSAPENLLGSVHEWTFRQAGADDVFASGGSWANGEFAFEGGLNGKLGEASRRAIDVGFRCVQPR